MSRMPAILGSFGVFVLTVVPLAAQETKAASPADGHTIHVLAPHVVAGKVMGPYHHYCKVLSPEPVIECLCYESNEPGARLHQVEYIIAKSITRTGAVSLADWNKYWHDHKQEIATLAHETPTFLKEMIILSIHAPLFYEHVLKPILAALPFEMARSSAE